jgi:ketosteroid isomerase-like protein
MPACLVITVRGDRITHIDEYLDPSVMAPAFEA